MPSEERQFYQDTLLKKSTTNSTMSSSASSQSGSILNPPASPRRENGTASPQHSTEIPSEDNSSLQPGSRAAKQNGIREVHHVTFAESHTEHGGTDQSEEETVIQENKTVTVVANCSRDIRSSGANGHVNNLESSHQNQMSPSLSCNQSGPSLSPTTQGAPLTPIIKLQRSASTESHENPFLADGELSKKADYIISHSTISRTELKIEDPDQSKRQVPVEEEIQVADGNVVHSAPPEQNRPNEIDVKDQNGKLEEPVAPSNVEVVEKANASQPEPEQAEEVKVKDNKKCKCCTIM